MREFWFGVLLVFYHLFPPAANAQTGGLHLDKAYYFAGEPIFFSVCLGTTATDSVMIMVRAWQEEELLEAHFHQSIRGQFDAYIVLPHDLHSGILVLEALAFEQKSSVPILLFSEAVSVFGDSLSSPPPTFFVSTSSPHVPLLLKASEISPSFSTDASLTQCKLTNLPIEAVGISVGIHESSGAMRDRANIRSFQHPLDQRVCKKRLPVRGKRLISDPAQPLQPFLLACQPDNLDFVSTIIDSEGRFQVEIAPMYETVDIQFLDCLLAQPAEVLDEPLPRSGMPLIVQVKDSTIGEEHRRYQERKRMYGLFNQLPHTLELVKGVKSIMQAEADAIVDVQDYAVQGNISELFREILTPLSFRQNRSGHPIRVFYRSQDGPIFHESAPLFIVNGTAMQDADFIRDLDLRQIRQVRIYSELATLRSLVGNCRIGGLVVIELADPLFRIPQKLALPSTRIPGLQRLISYPIQGNPSLPRVQKLVYWSPYEQVETKELFDFTFVSPDLLGSYTLEGMIQDQSGKLYVYRFPLIKSQEGWQLE